jgi:hypothetical protein
MTREHEVKKKFKLLLTVIVNPKTIVNPSSLLFEQLTISKALNS